MFGFKGISNTEDLIKTRIQIVTNKGCYKNILANKYEAKAFSYLILSLKKNKAF
ncbi:hypothetical protein CLV91_2778 [Maribacter vaceletii]|uniref:Uncharacterized protein n=1 Tax=Maribacter vaceletii TaxID=1206816 RepID=A0A495DTQ7_9FLAO|nr:hypothetical protein CLV91_2778 [Maribacter vaceletii]